MDELTPQYGHEPPPAPVDDPVQCFCKLTFGQFFTLVVLLVMTLCFTFYVGARYGNQYLRIGEEGVPNVAATPAMTAPATPIVPAVPLPEDVQADERLKALAREALMSQQRGKLEGEMQQMLSGQAPVVATPQPALPVTPTNEPVVIGTPPAELQAPVVLRQAQDERSGQSAETTQQLPGELVASRPSTEQPLPAHVSQQLPATSDQRPATSDAVPPAPAVLKSSASMPYAVQIGAYQDQREAAYYVEEWKAKGYPAYLVMANLGDRGQWYRVRVGGFPTKDAADHYLTELQSKEGTNGIVVVNGPE